MYEKLLEPIKINQTELKNRMIMSAMASNYANLDGTATEKMIAYYERRAKGGWGLIITEDYRISPDAGAVEALAGLWDDSQIESHRVATDRVHKAGGKICCQLYHAGRVTMLGRVIAPSAVKDPTMSIIPNELTVDEIHELVEQFGDAALRAQKAGFDAVEIHAAHGYLVSQFLSPFANKRGDEYGGTLLNRTRFAVEIVKNIRSKCGEAFPIMFRISVQEFVPGGLSIEENRTIARILESVGVDAIHCSQGIYASSENTIPCADFPKAVFADNAAAIKSAVSIPVIAVGRISDPLLADTIIATGKADMCTMGRASLADADLPNKVAAGKPEEIRYCIGCLQGCLGENGKGNPIRCLMDPLTGMEDVYCMKETDSPKHIVIVGGGVAGCEAAVVAAQRGHRVTILEKTGKLGGQWLLAAVPPNKSDLTNLICWQRTMLHKLGVEIVYNVTATKEVIRQYQPDVVVNATGSVPSMPPIPGLKEYSVNARQVLAGEVPVGANVVVIGGGLVGAETADHLSMHGHKTTVIEMQPQIMSDAVFYITMKMTQRYAQNGVQVLTSAKVTKVGENSVSYEVDGKEYTIEAVDTVINAVGHRSDTALAEELEGIEYPVISIGDAKEARNGYLAIREGYELGLSI